MVKQIFSSYLIPLQEGFMDDGMVYVGHPNGTHEFIGESDCHLQAQKMIKEYKPNNQKRREDIKKALFV